MAVTYKGTEGKYHIPRSFLDGLSSLIDALDLEQSVYESRIVNAQVAISEFYPWPNIVDGLVCVYPDGHIEIEPNVNNIRHKRGISVSPGGILIHNKMNREKHSYDTMCKTRKYAISIMTSMQQLHSEWDELNEMASQLNSAVDLYERFNGFMELVALKNSNLKKEVGLRVTGLENPMGLGSLAITNELLYVLLSMGTKFWSDLLYSSSTKFLDDEIKLVFDEAGNLVTRAVNLLALLLKHEEDFCLPVIRRVLALSVKAIYGPTPYQGRLRELIEENSVEYRDAMEVADGLKLKVDDILSKYR